MVSWEEFPVVKYPNEVSKGLLAAALIFIVKSKSSYDIIHGQTLSVLCSREIELGCKKKVPFNVTITFFIGTNLCEYSQFGN